MAFVPPVLISCNNEAWREPRSAWQVGSLGHRVIGGFLEDEALALGVSEEFCEREQGTWRCEYYIPSFLPGRAVSLVGYGSRGRCLICGRWETPFNLQFEPNFEANHGVLPSGLTDGQVFNPGANLCWNVRRQAALPHGHTWMLPP